MIRNPFTSSSSQAGLGRVKLSLIHPNTSVLEEISYQYPLKLIAPSSVEVDVNHRPLRVYTIFLLTYGGGLVGGDAIDLHISLATTTRLTLLTQGSTKVFNSARNDIVTKQDLTVDLHQDSALCYLPDPVQPFAESVFEQRQRYNLLEGTANLCACDWVSEGRTARGEKWSFHSYISRNEVWYTPVMGESKERLLLRDNLILDQNQTHAKTVVDRMDSMGIFGTLILCGPLFQPLAEFFMGEFNAMLRIGSRQWDAPDESAKLSALEKFRLARLELETRSGILWTSAATRGFVVVKFGAAEVEGARKWLAQMLKFEGSIEGHFGERALLCLR